MSLPQSKSASTLIVRCGTLIDGTSSPPRSGVALVIQGGTIREIIPPEQWRMERAAAATQVIDATSATVLPGLVDLHVHLACVDDPSEPHPVLSMISATPPMLTLYAARNGRLMLEAGFTTVRDMAGTTSFLNTEVVALRRGIEIGLVPGPRVFAAGWVCQTGGHLDQALPSTWPWPMSDRDGPWAVRRQVREMVRGGVDLIKVSAKGHYTDEELVALADEAHALERRVAIHARTVGQVKQALRAGMDTIEHGTELDDDAIGLLLDRGAYLVPTLSGRGHGLARRIRSGANAVTVQEHRSKLDAAIESARKAHQAGVKIACGTDTYRSIRDHWGDNAYELEMLVQAGLSPMESVVAATMVSAEALGQDKRLGTLEVGKVADLLVFDGDPLKDIRLLQQKQRIRLVVKEGEIVVDRSSSYQ